MTFDLTEEQLGRLIAFTAAIFHAEGFWVPGARPRRNRNPGDLLDHAGVNIHYTTTADGAAHAGVQVFLMLTGMSHVYSLSMSWRRVAQLWTGGDNAEAWCAAVCDDLGVDPDSTLGQFAQPAQFPQAAALLAQAQAPENPDQAHP